MKNRYIIGVIGLVLTSLVLVGIITTRSSISPTDYFTDVTTQNLHDIKLNYDIHTEKEVQDLLENGLDKETQILFKKLVKDTENRTLVLEAIYDSDKLRTEFDSERIYDLESFNKFLQETQYSSANEFYSPITLLDSKVGNCYAYTLLTMYFIDRYYENITYEVITDTYVDTSHVYLKLKSDKEDVVCDLTENCELILPRE